MTDFSTHSPPVAALTGAAGGIGQATAVALVAAGWRVLLLDREIAGLSAVAARTGQPAFACDVTDRAAVAALVADLWATQGPIDLWVNNAGLGYFRPFAAQARPPLEAAMAVNFWGSLNCIEAIIPLWRERGQGHLIQVTSAAATLPAFHQSGYAATKAAMSALLRALRLDLRGSGIAITEILPAAVTTPMVRGANRAALSPLVLRVAIPPERVAAAIVAATRHRPREVYLPRLAWLTLWLHRLAPGPTEWALTRWSPSSSTPGAE